MSKPKKKYPQVWLSLSEKQLQLIDNLIKAGLHGKTRSAVASRLIDSALLQILYPTPPK